MSKVGEFFLKFFSKPLKEIAKRMLKDAYDKAVDKLAGKDIDTENLSFGEVALVLMDGAMDSLAGEDVDTENMTGPEILTKLFELLLNVVTNWIDGKRKK